MPLDAHQREFHLGVWFVVFGNEKTEFFPVGRLSEVEKHQKRKRGMGQRGTTAHWTQLAERRR